MHKLSVVLYKLSEAVQNLFISVTKWYFSKTLVHLLLTQHRWLVLKKLVPADVEADKVTVYPNHWKQPIEAGWSQALPADIKLS